MFSEQFFYQLERADYASRLLIERRSLKDEDVTNESRAEPGVRSHCRFISIGDAHGARRRVNPCATARRRQAPSPVEGVMG